MRGSAKGRARTMNNVSGGSEMGGRRLGPAVYTEILVNGIPTKTLIDTGSPATIVSPDYIMDLLAAERRPHQTPEQWEKATLQRFSPPEVSLTAYGGQALDILSQLPLRLSQGKLMVEGVVLVQKGAPNDLLLGTDLQSKLGFALTMDTPKEKINLLETPSPTRDGETHSRKGHSPQTPSPTRDGETHSREGHSPQTPSPTRDGETHSREGHSLQTPSPTRDGEIHSREGHSQDTPSPTRDGETHSREGHSLQTPSPTRDGEIHSREGHSQDTPSPTRDGETHLPSRDPRIPDPLPFSAVEQDHIRELTLTGQPERVPSGASDMAPSQSSAGGTEKVGCQCRTITPETIRTSTGAAGCRPEGSMDNRILPSSTDTLVPLPTGTVHLLKAEKIPARHRKLVLVRIHGEENTNSLLFTPGCDDGAVTMADAFIEGSSGGCVTLLVENRENMPLILNAGLQLGTTMPAEEVEPGALLCQDPGRDSTTEAEATGLVCALGPNSAQDRRRQLVEQLDMRMEHLSDSERKQLEDYVLSHDDVFALDPSELGTTDVTEHIINTAGHPPIRQPPRRMPFALRGHVDKLVKEMLEQQVIVPSASPWASPVVLVRKKDGGVRFCVDYRKLNSETKLDEFPLPRVDDTLNLLSGARYFTTLDLASGYWQVTMEGTSQEKTAFATHSGLYEFRKMPFGLVNAPATFQRLMEIVLSGVARNGCHVYLDDVLVFGRTLEEHNHNLGRVFDRIRKAGLRLQPKKCVFAQLSVEYLGHLVSEKGIQTSPEKVVALESYRTPADLKALRSFIGFASYYRRFVPGFSKIASPLYALTKKGVRFVWGEACQRAFDQLKELLQTSPVLCYPDFARPFILETDASHFVWGEACQRAFDQLKELLQTSPVLCYPDFARPFILETDASGIGLGAVLAKEQPDGIVRPIAYASRSLQQNERNYGVTELEGLGVVWAVKHFRVYLYGHKCMVYTDHQALKSLLNTPQPSGRLARWGMALQEMDLAIVHRSGKHNANADALSRCPLPTCTDDHPTAEVVAALSGTELQTDGAEEDNLAALQQVDEELKPIIVYLTTGVLPEDDKHARQVTLTAPRYMMLDGILYRVEDDSSLRVVPPHSCRRALFDAVHSGKFGAHLGDLKVHSELRKHYWWEGMRRDITQWTRACLTCATYQTGRRVKPPLTPLPVSGAFDRIGVDVLQLPRTKRGNRYAVVFVDYLTKWPEVFAVADQTSVTIARLLVEEVVSRHGVPTDVLSDRGKAFLSGLMQEVGLLLGYRKVNTTAYHPQTDSLVERYNRTLIGMLAKTVDKGGVEWDERLPYVLFAYRASQQLSTKESPFYLLYGRDPRLPVPSVLSPAKTRTMVDLREYGIELHDKMSTAWELARQAVKRAQKRQKDHYDRGTTTLPFREGERVYLYKPMEKTGAARKLARAFHGPYRVREMGDNTASIVRVDRPEEGPMLVSLGRLRRCPRELNDEFWPPKKSGGRKRTRAVVHQPAPPQSQQESQVDSPAGEVTPGSGMLLVDQSPGAHTSSQTGAGNVQDAMETPVEGSHRVTEEVHDAVDGLEQLPTPISPTSEDIDLSLHQQLQGGRRVPAGKWAGRLRPRTGGGDDPRSLWLRRAS